jgi:hypothetical protein
MPTNSIYSVGGNPSGAVILCICPEDFSSKKDTAIKEPDALGLPPTPPPPLYRSRKMEFFPEKPLLSKL